MTENHYLTKTEQLVMETLADTAIITVSELHRALPEVRLPTLHKLLSSLVRKGQLARLRRGTYLRAIDGGVIIEDPRQVALALFPGYIAFASALAHWGLLGYEVFTIHVATQRTSRVRAIGEYEVRAVAMGRRCQGMVFAAGIYVSSLEKTLFDCLYRPTHAGGLQVVAAAIAEADPDWAALLGWFDRFASPGFRQRAGFIIDRAGSAPVMFLTRLRPAVLNRIRLDPSGPRHGSYSKEWRVIDNSGGWDA